MRAIRRGYLDPYRINAYALAQFAATRADRSPET
jgi:hypothetical protein